MKNINYILFVIVLVASMGCKQKEWTEWKVQNEIWLQQNAKKEGVKTTPNGLQYKILYEGNPTAAKPSSVSSVLVTYTGKLINGVVFDSSSSVSLSLPSMIKGFTEGLTKIHKTGDIEIYIPWELGYGASGRGVEGYAAYIPPYSTLIFRVHLNDIAN